jgi:hypothetical protein
MYELIEGGDNWPVCLDAHDVQFLILDVQWDGDLLQSIQSEPGWTVDFQDAENILLVRTRTAPQHPSAGWAGYEDEEVDVEPGL